MTKELTCAWLSRHTPTVNQSQSLCDYRIVMVCPSRRFLGARDAWNTAIKACGSKTPDLFVVVLPDAWEKEFVKLACIMTPNTPVLCARMLPPDYRYWSGEWRALEVVNNVLTWYSWKPEPVR